MPAPSTNFRYAGRGRFLRRRAMALMTVPDTFFANMASISDPTKAGIGARLGDLDALWNEVTVDEKERLRFRTYSNYLDALGRHLRPRVLNPALYLRPVVECGAFKSIQGGRCSDVGRVGELLRAAWMTEVQMHLSAMEEQLAALTIHWLPVKGYYTLYLLVRAWLLTKNDRPSHDHTKTLVVWSQTIKRTPELFPDPWRWLCTGEPSPSHAGHFHHLPDGVKPSRISAIASVTDDDLVSPVCLFLKTTRQRKIEQRIEEWRKRAKKKRLPTSERPAIVAGVHDTSLFDALYRMRIRSNYDDADSYIIAASDVTMASRFHQNIRTVTWSAALLVEALIARTLGKREYEAQVDRFLRSEPGRLAAQLLGARWAAVKPLW